MEIRKIPPNPDGKRIKLMLIGLYVKSIKAHPECIMIKKTRNIITRRIHCTNGEIIETVIKDI